MGERIASDTERQCTTPGCAKSGRVAELFYTRSDGRTAGYRTKCKVSYLDLVRRNRATNANVQAYDRRRYAENPERRMALNAGSIRRRTPLIMRARAAVQRALKRGELTKPEACEHCGRTGLFLEAAHVDYQRPLEVLWLCRRDHRIWDGRDPKSPTGARGLEYLVEPKAYDPARLVPRGELAA